MVNKQVYSFVAKELNTRCSQGKMTSMFPCRTEVQMKEYMRKMTPSDARLLFAIRSKTIDLRGVRTYMYEEATCRLCEQGIEDIDHILNTCIHVTRTKTTFSEMEILGDDIQISKEVVTRMKQFITKVEDIVSSESNRTTAE